MSNPDAMETGRKSCNFRGVDRAFSHGSEGNGRRCQVRFAFAVDLAKIAGRFVRRGG